MRGLEGVTIGKGSVVAAGAVVTHDIPSYSVAAGIPANVIKAIDEKTKSKTEIMQELRQYYRVVHELFVFTHVFDTV